jgi:Protein of unknown function (DUF3788)
MTKMGNKFKPPTDAELEVALGAARVIWTGLIQAVGEEFAPLDMLWKPCKTGIGRVCLLQHKKRTLVYLTPDKERVWIAIVLGERAYSLAMASPIPATIKKLFSEARPYAEGRGIRFPLNSARDIPVIAELITIKMTPK